MSKSLKTLGDELWKNAEKTSGEVFFLLYGSLVSNLIETSPSIARVNEQLEQIGYNIGVRLVDEFLARSGISKCQDFKETCELIKVGSRMFLGVAPALTMVSAREGSFVFDELPWADFVELPSGMDLQYSNVLCGAVRGALEMVFLRVECSLPKCSIRGDDFTELRVELKEILDQEAPFHDS